MKRIETLHTPRLTLRPPTAADRPGYSALHRDPVDAQAIADEIDEYAVDFERGWSVHWSCIEKQTGAFVGFVALHEFLSPAPILSYAIVPEQRREGFAMEAIGAVLEHTSNLAKADAIVAHVHLDNAASAELLNKLGFVETGRVELPRGVRREFRWALER